MDTRDLETVVHEMEKYPSLYAFIPTSRQLDEALSALEIEQPDALYWLKFVKARILRERDEIDDMAMQRAADKGLFGEIGVDLFGDDSRLDDMMDLVYSNIHKSVGDLGFVKTETDTDKIRSMESCLFSSIIFAASVQLCNQLGIENQF